MSPEPCSGNSCRSFNAVITFAFADAGAFSTLSTAASNPCVGARELVARLAMRLLCLLRGDGLRAWGVDILGLRARSQMARVDTGPISTEMVKDKSMWDGAFAGFVSKPVCGDIVFLGEAEHAVAIGIQPPLPIPTVIIRNNFDLAPEPDSYVLPWGCHA